MAGAHWPGWTGMQAAFQGPPSHIPGVIMASVHNHKILRFEYLNHQTPEFYNELWLSMMVGADGEPYRPGEGTPCVDCNFTAWRRRDTDKDMATGITTTNTPPFSESGCHGNWQILHSGLDGDTWGIEMQFDFLGRFDWMHYCNKETRVFRHSPMCAHRQFGYDLAGTDHRGRVIWMRLLHEFTLLNRCMRGIKRPPPQPCSMVPLTPLPPQLQIRDENEPLPKGQRVD